MMTTIEAFPPVSPDPRLLERLVCPITKQAVYYDAQRNAIISPAADCAFPVRDGIPIMLPEEAQKLSSTEHTA